MSQTVRFGIIGGYGATGRVVVSELWKSRAGEILIGGRDLAKGNALSAEFDNRVSATHVDVLDASSLDRFCSGCSIIVNCGGPVMLLQDRVAQAAFRGRCHYIDIAGLSFVKERMLSNDREIANSGLSFVVSAGWLPGISELLPVYAHQRALTKMDMIESLTVYFGDSGEWSATAYQDTVWHLRHSGLRSPFYFRKGERVRANVLRTSPRVDLGGRVGLRRFTIFSIPELDQVGHQLSDCDVFTYSYLPSLRAAMAAALVTLFPLPDRLSVRLLRKALRRVPLPVGGFVVVHVAGRLQGHGQVLKTQIVYERQRDYWINGVVVSTVARMVSQGKDVQAGVHFLADGVNPAAFMAELRKVGVEQTEDFESSGEKCVQAAKEREPD
jgi:saccharopine dehydrogenase (NAD+, L-lysine forming)